MVFKWKETFYTKIDAEVAGQVLTSMEKEGRLSTRNLVDDSKKKSAPLHDYFEWDDAKAADGYRLHQASNLIHSLIIQEDEDAKEQQQVFYNIKSVGSTYYSVDSIKSNADLFNALEAQAINELKSFQTRFNGIKRLQPVMNAIEEIIKEK